MNDRTKILALVFILAQQLRAWLSFARDAGHMQREFKYLSGILFAALDRFLKYFFDGHAEEDDTVYEHSVKVSEVVEKLLSLDDDDLRRVEGLILKMQKYRDVKKAA